MMLTKEKSKNNALLKFGLIAPLFLSMLVVASACKEKLTGKFLIANSSSSENQQKIEGPVLISVDTRPEFPGGIEEMYQFISENISYSQDARNNKISGSVFIKFIVDKNGEVGNYEVLKGLGYGLEEEAIRVLALMPNWKPGLHDKLPANVYFTMPFIFQLEKTAEKLSPNLI